MMGCLGSLLPMGNDMTEQEITRRSKIMELAAKAGVSPVNDEQIKFEGPMWLCLERFAKLVMEADKNPTTADGVPW
jgi:hypothetical protein